MRAVGRVWGVCVAAVVTVCLSHATAACETDIDCSLNGVCSAHKCVCDTAWKGDDCGQLNFIEHSIEFGNNGYDQTVAKNVSSWGGNFMQDETGLYHLYVAEMAGGCLLNDWGHASQVTHAVSHSPLGPYTFRDVAIPVWAHNPQLGVTTNGSDTLYYIYHIGDATTRSPPNCTHSAVSDTGSPPPSSAPGSTLHTSKYLDGPWEPYLPSPHPCNNPSPVDLHNGTWLLVCDHANVLRGPSVFGPWTQASTLNLTGIKGGDVHWEDPYIWVDSRHNIHVLFHVYDSITPCGACTGAVASGHNFSPDGVKWYSSSTQPYSASYTTTDGQTKVAATRERPKLVFNKQGQPAFLVTGVTGTAACPPLFASHCKFSYPGDNTFTLIEPIHTSP